MRRRGFAWALGGCVLLSWVVACTAGSVSNGVDPTPSVGTCCSFSLGNVSTCTCNLDGGAAACVPKNDASATLVESCTTK